MSSRTSVSLFVFSSILCLSFFLPLAMAWAYDPASRSLLPPHVAVGAGVGAGPPQGSRERQPAAFCTMNFGNFLKVRESLNGFFRWTMMFFCGFVFSACGSSARLCCCTMPPGTPRA